MIQSSNGRRIVSNGIESQSATSFSACWSATSEIVKPCRSRTAWKLRRPLGLPLPLKLTYLTDSYNFIRSSDVLPCSAKGELDHDELLFFLTGGVGIQNTMANPTDKSWLSDRSWDEICRMSALPSFKGFTYAYFSNTGLLFLFFFLVLLLVLLDHVLHHCRHHFLVSK